MPGHKEKKSKKDVLLNLRQQLDTALHDETAGSFDALERYLENALRELRGKNMAQASKDELEEALRFFEEAWFGGSAVPLQFTGQKEQQTKLSKLLADIIAVENFTLSLAKGDLSQSLKVKGLMAGSLKGLQANLRHLTWQTQMVAKGDFSQRVDFMGEFSESFNAMVTSLAEMRDQLRHREEELHIANTHLLEEITEVKKAREQLRQLTKELKRSNADLQQFARFASHDLQAPLRTANGFLTLFVKKYGGKLDEKADELLGFISGGIQEMQTIIKDLLEYSRVENQDTATGSVDTTQALDTALLNLKVEIDEKNARVTRAEHMPTVTGDRMQIIRLFQNLVGNAIKYHGTESPAVHVSALQNDGRWVFSVQDNGIGIHPEDHARIFELFQRLHGKSEFSGTGIGLAICKRIVERQGGRIWVESEPGKGATFFFSIPSR